MRGAVVCGSLLVLLVALGACGSSDGVAPDAPLPAVDAPIDSPAAGLAVAPAAHAFGAVEIGAGSSALALVVSTDSTTGALTVTIGGPNASELVRVFDTCNGISLAPQATCTVYVSLQPSSLGAKSAQVQIAGSPGGTATVTITGTAALPAQRQSIAPTTFNFGTAPATGFAPSPKRFTVTNTGSAAVGPMTAIITGIDASSFDIDDANDTCTNHINAPGDSCTVDVYFSPPTVGAKSARLAISPLATSTIAMLSGTATEPPSFMVTPTPIDFGSVAVGTSSPATTLTLTNVGVGPSGTIAATSGGPQAAEFVVLPGSTCIGISLAPGATCTVLVRFTPADVGPRQSVLLIGDEIFAALASVSGMGLVGDGVGIVPQLHAFGERAPGTTSAPQTFTIPNPGGSPSGPVSLTIGGTDPGSFHLVAGADHCTSVSIAPGGFCTFDAVFSPASPGAKTARISSLSSPGGTAATTVSGIGVATLGL